MDIWDWLGGLRRWWWILLIFPLAAGAASWILAPTPKYESSWTANIYFDDPMLADNPNYIDFIFLDDLALLMKTGVLGDVMYLRLPDNLKENLSREEFGGMFSSARKAHFVEVTVAGDDPETVVAVAETITANLTEVANHYLVPADYPLGSATINILDPISPPTRNTRDRLIRVGSITTATLIASVAVTGVAEWLRRSYLAKNAAI